MSIDARGLGETRPALDTHDHFFTYFADHDNAETAILLGKTLVGMRAADIARGVDLLAARSEVDPANIAGIGRGAAAVAMLHAAAFDPRIKKLVLGEMLVSYDAIVRHRIHRQMFEQIVPSALKFYDLPDLANSLTPRRFDDQRQEPAGPVLPPAAVRAVYGRAQVQVTRGEGQPAVNPVLDDLQIREPFHARHHAQRFATAAACSSEPWLGGCNERIGSLSWVGGRGGDHLETGSRGGSRRFVTKQTIAEA
jgi:pimeloyl-ACP methyl ester carboxylesterase